MQFAAEIQKSEDLLNPRALIAIDWRQVWRLAMSIGWAVTKAYESQLAVFGAHVDGWPSARKQFEVAISSRSDLI